MFNSFLCIDCRLVQKLKFSSINEKDENGEKEDDDAGVMIMVTMMMLMKE